MKCYFIVRHCLKRRTVKQKNYINVVNQTNYVKLQIGMIINGINTTRILIALVLVLLQNSILYCPRAMHSLSKETCLVKAFLLGQSKTSYYKVLLYDHSIFSYA
jgi:hypothetical protein